MTKYSNGFKVKVINEYLKGKSSRALADKYHVPTHAQILKWVHQFQVNGLDGFQTSIRHPAYTFHFKLSVLKWMGENHSTFENTACHFNIPAVSTVHKWETRFELNGSDGLKNKRGRPPMGKRKREVINSKGTRKKRQFRQMPSD